MGSWKGLAVRDFNLGPTWCGALMLTGLSSAEFAKYSAARNAPDMRRNTNPTHPCMIAVVACSV